MENIRRKAKGEEPLKELKKEDEDALPTEAEKPSRKTTPTWPRRADPAGLPEDHQTGGQAVNDGDLM